MRVLVIEDDDDVTLLYRLALEHAGYSVEIAATGRDGLQLAAAHHPDVIVLDGMLPDIDGLEVLDTLAGDAGTASIPVVMASARVGGSDRAAALARGAAAYVMKPFEPDDIAGLVGRVLGNGRPAASATEVPVTPTAHRALGVQRRVHEVRPAAPTVDDASPHPHGAGDLPTPVAPDRGAELTVNDLLSVSADGIISVDEGQRIVGFNKGAEVIFGYLAEEVLGKPLDLLLPEHLASMHREQLASFAVEPGFARAMGAERFVTGRRRDGSEFPAEASITRLEIGGRRMLTAIVRDASERRRVEEELRNRAEQQTAVADLSLRAITEAPLDTFLQDAAQTLARVLRADFVNLSMWDETGTHLVMVAGVGWEKDVVGTARCRTEPGSLGAFTLHADAPVVFEVLDDDGRFAPEPHLVEAGVTSGMHCPLRGRGRPAGLVGVYSRARRAYSSDDVNALRAIANTVASALQRHSYERRLRAYLDSAPDATVIVDRAGRIVSANAQAEALFGYTRSELLRLSVDALVPEGRRVAHRAHREAYGDQPRPRPMGEGLVLSARRKDGTEVPVDIMLRPVVTDEGPFVVAAVRDITERRRNEAARDAFLHAVSHELRTPLTAVMGFSALLTDRYAEELPADALDLARRIRASAGRLERLLSDLLDLDRLGRGVLTAQRSVVRIRALIDACVEQVSLEGRRLCVTVDPPDLRASVDASQLDRIVENLLQNAVRHTPPDASIDVRVTESRNGILLVVEDDGPGVPAAMRELIFEPFRRDAAPGTAGTGIGLSLVARFAELHGGRAWVEDRPGGGASFRVVLAT